jgi:hypothetical protein
MSDRILIAEISGKRPGTAKQRPTERFESQHDWVIISNNSEGYETDKPIINVPDDYREWYCANIKNSDNAWYAPMNRSYAIKWARENGYDYLIQLDDNIAYLEICTVVEKNGITIRHRLRDKNMLDDYIEMFVAVLHNTNAVMAGCQLNGIGVKDGHCFIKEGFVYSIFALKLSDCPDVFHGDFEDDVEYRLKCKQIGLPVVQITPFRYSKTGQAHSRDLSGCRAEYLKAGLKRGEHMSKLYGDIYSCKMSHKRAFSRAQEDSEAINFRHYLKPFKVGVVVYNMEPITRTFREILAKYAKHKPDKSIFKIKKRRKAKT